MSYGRGQGGFPGDSSPQGRGGKKAGGGIFTLLIIGAVIFFMFGGFNRNANQNQPGQEQQGGGFDEDSWRPDQGQDRNADRNRQFDIDGDRNANTKPQNDKVENEDGWSLGDVDGKKKKQQFNFSDKKQEPASDAVKKDGWEMKDRDNKGKGGTRVPLSNESKPKSDAVKKDGWEVKDATGKGSGNN